MKARKRMRGAAAVAAAVVGAGLAVASPASADITTTTPGAGQGGPRGESLTVTIPPRTHGGAGGSGNPGPGGSGNAGGTGGPGEFSVRVPAAGTLTFSSNGTTAKGYLGPVNVSDTRQSSPGWMVYGQASDSGGTIPGNALGWTPTVTSSTGRVTVGRPVPPNSPGLGGRAAKLGSSTGDGTATLGASLSLAIPAGQATGTHGITITITTTA